MTRAPKNIPKRRHHAKKSSSAVVGIVVRRGALRRFNALAEKVADLPAVVTWDRRQADRRASSQPAQTDQRKTERRQKPPFTWEVADFVVSDRAPEHAARSPRMAKAAKPQAARKKRA